MSAVGQVTYHHENGLWWFDSEDLPGYYAGADTLAELDERVAEGVRFHQSADGVDWVGEKPSWTP